MSPKYQCGRVGPFLLYVLQSKTDVTSRPRARAESWRGGAVHRTERSTTSHSWGGPRTAKPTPTWHQQCGKESLKWGTMNKFLPVAKRWRKEIIEALILNYTKHWTLLRHLFVPSTSRVMWGRKQDWCQERWSYHAIEAVCDMMLVALTWWHIWRLLGWQHTWSPLFLQLQEESFLHRYEVSWANGMSPPTSSPFINKH